MNRTVGEVMTTEVVTARGDMPFKVVAELLQANHVSAVPVVDERRVVGIVSEADLLLKEEHLEGGPGRFARRRRLAEHQKAAGTVASRIMTAPAITIRPEASLAEAARSMHRHGVKRLPVVDEEGVLVGIVSRADLLSVFVRPDADIQQAVIQDVVVEALWVDPATLRVHVNDGVVTLWGQVERRSQVEDAGTLAGRVDGVVAVRNELSFRIDDVGLRPEVPTPWGVLPPALR